MTAVAFIIDGVCALLGIASALHCWRTARELKRMQRQLINLPIASEDDWPAGDDEEEEDGEHDYFAVVGSNGSEG